MNRGYCVFSMIYGRSLVIAQSRRAFLVSLPLWFAFSAPTSAQIRPPARSQDGLFCLRPYRSQSCPLFWITEATVARLLSDTTVGDLHSYVTIDAGVMLNQNPYALGSSFYYGIHVDGRRGGVRARARRWWNDDVATDLAVGAVLGGRDRRMLLSYPGWTAEIALQVTDYFKATGGVEVVGRQSGGSVVDWHAGGAFAGQAGAIAGIGTILLYLLFGLIPVDAPPPT